MKFFILYLILINLISAGLFIFDKDSAIRNGQRIQEATFHLLELLGGVFAVIVMIPATLKDDTTDNKRTVKRQTKCQRFAK